MMVSFMVFNLGGMVEYSKLLADRNVGVTNEGTEANW